ncbi:ATP-dependent Zn protease [Maize bushy stunt phytoplasma]|uniref:ATP-dependent Zn protease n=1 Tax=Maize bushy stunt phytoplasma TaxID=202462 RepID=A0ABM6DLG5_9MOLU|nr:AAA family ATPase [Maize bushy stunt phytoplasma]AOF54636.1 ATP-dependent Zn protease [Maize bushy stunt phytoplasma]
MKWEPQRFEYPEPDNQPKNPPNYPILPKKPKNYFAIATNVSAIIVNIMVIFFMFVLIKGSENLSKTMGKDTQEDTMWAQEKEYRPKGNLNIDSFSGYDEVKDELREYISAVNDDANEINPLPRKDLPRGVLLYGPPGTGKTYLAKCLVGSVKGKAPFFITTGSDFVEKYIGVGAARVRELFKVAQETAKQRGQSYYFIFIDEIDAIGAERSKEKSAQEHSGTLNALLTQLDGVDSDEKTPQAIVIGATNRKDFLDDALIREGRLGKHIYLGTPDLKTTQALLIAFMKRENIEKTNYPSDDELKQVAKILHGSKFTPSDINSLVKEAKKIASKDTNSPNKITPLHIYDAMDLILMGPELKQSISKADKKRVINHELGHAIVAHALGFDVHRVTSKPRGQAAGYTIFFSASNEGEQADQLLTKQDLLKQMITALAGRAAEEAFETSVSFGCCDDLKKVRTIATKMVKEFGMSLGSESMDFSLDNDTQAKEINAIIQASYNAAKEIIEKYKEDPNDKDNKTSNLQWKNLSEKLATQNLGKDAFVAEESKYFYTTTISIDEVQETQSNKKKEYKIKLEDKKFTQRPEETPTPQSTSPSDNNK